MKKILLLLAFVTYLFSCKDTAPSTQHAVDGDTLTAAEWAKYPEYQRRHVIEMQKYYHSIPKTNSNIIGMVTMDNHPLRRILKEKGAFYIIAGAYLADTLGRKKGDLATIVGIKDSGKVKFYDFGTIFLKSAVGTSGGGDICPPPEPPCPLPEDEIQ